jgi:hypothetical protein
MTPSQDALDINEAHKLVKQCLGTSLEVAARVNLERVVARVKARRRS